VEDTISCDTLGVQPARERPAAILPEYTGKVASDPTPEPSESGGYLTSPPEGGGWAWFRVSDLRAFLPLIGPHAFAVYLALRCYADGKTDRAVYPGVRLIEKDTGLSRPTVVKSLAALRQAGLIEVSPRGTQGHQYQFPLVNRVNRLTAQTGLDDEPELVNGVARTGKRRLPEQDLKNKTREQDRSPLTPQGGHGQERVHNSKTSSQRKQIPPDLFNAVAETGGWDPSIDLREIEDTCFGLLEGLSPPCTAEAVRQLVLRLRNASSTPGSARDKSSGPKPPAELFEAVAEIGGADPSINRRQIERVCRHLMKGEPPYTASDVRRLPSAISEAGLEFTLTVKAIPQYISWVRHQPSRADGRSYNHQPGKIHATAAKREQYAKPGTRVHNDLPAAPAAASDVAGPTDGGGSQK
jgi:DNA-binding transcriptional ArsR family regulator